jgi:hypothetical protein
LDSQFNQFNTSIMKIKMGGFRKALIKWAFKILNEQIIQRIPFAPLRGLLSAHHNLYVDVVDVMTDKDPDNAAQLAEVWKANQARFVNSSLAAVSDGIRNLVKDEAVAGYIIELLEEVADELDGDEVTEP